ncbi:MAG: MFS transporter [Proteobacteria bacterium]|nr:MFS transporter [Pseudomonadota bacterium]
MSDPQPDRLSPVLVARVFLPFAAGYFLSYLFRVVNAVIAPDLTLSLGLDAADLGLLTSVYFVTFAAFQLPLGILLDRFGPRRVEAALLLFAVAGAGFFAAAQSLGALMLARGLIGLGVSACLMASFKAFVIWFPRERLPLANGCVLAAGGLGALSATAPVEAALAFTDWRGLFLIIGLMTLAASLAIFVAVPERRDRGEAGPGLAEQARGVGEVFGSALFWRVAPFTLASQATFLAVQGLWAGPWLADVAGLARAGVANHLLAIAAAMVAGFLILGRVAERAERLGLRPLGVAVAGMLAFVAAQAAIVAGLARGPLVAVLWIGYGFFGTSGVITYAALSQRFPAALAGRLNTGLNLLVFVASSAAQWGIGAVVNLWPRAASGGYPPEAYGAAFALVLALQGAAFAWFVVAPLLFRGAR